MLRSLSRYSSQSAPSSWSTVESRCIRALQGVLHPETKRDVVYSGLIQKLEPRPGGSVLVHLDLDRHYRDLRPLVINALKSIADVEHVEIRMAPASKSDQAQPSIPTPEAFSGRRGGLADVDAVISVSSCKGGVGKSTVSVNLAYGLAQAGLRVGLLDADLFGPSLPALIGRPGQRLHRDGAGRVLPLDHGGVRCLSYGFLAPDPQAATVLRGPVVSKIVQQLVLGTAWGQLDYLIVDMPPGTGDIPLSLMQAASLTANVVVTTPQTLSRIDVVKGLAMFNTLAVPTIAVVHNMAYFVCDRCDTRHFPFGQQTQDSMGEFKIPIHVDVPIQKQIGDDVDLGVPTMLSDNPRCESVRSVMRSLSISVHHHTRSLREAARPLPEATIEQNGDLAFTDRGQSRGIRADRLRQQCRCAACLQGGSRTEQRRHRVIGVRPVGNYGIEIDWDDGHKGSIYPFDLLRELSRPEELSRESELSQCS